ncbi:cytochrome P450 [uncultured Mycobacterium sp.]|uniref:cytochrome P450 n=1 Tax=uncultured Mycobacterium sp. TaxID=171292 RepID=UPI0035C94A67
MQWDYNAAFAELASGHDDSTAPIYSGLLENDEVRRVLVDETPYEIVMSYDRVIEAVKNHKALSSVTPRHGGPRILPLQSDPPEHSGYRRLLNQYFSRSRIDDVEKRIQPIAAEMLDQMIRRGTADFATEFAYPFPTRALCAFLELPDDDWVFHHEWVTELERLTKDGLSDPEEGVFGALGNVLPYLFRVVAQRREKPGSDVISGVIAGTIDGRPLDDQEIGNTVIALMMAGHITTTGGVGNLVLRLADDPQLQAFLRANPDRIPDAVEESLRLDSPQQAMPRKAVRDVDIAGQHIQSGDYVVLNYGSANVDPAHWPRPDRFDLDRADKRHLAFGRGIHQCVGAPLARMQMQLVARELLARTASFELIAPARRVAWPRLAVENMQLSFVAA